MGWGELTNLKFNPLHTVPGPELEIDSDKPYLIREAGFLQMAEKQRSDKSRGAGRVTPVTPGEAQTATGSSDANLQTVRLNEVIGSLWLPNEAPEEQQVEVVHAALAALKEIGPQDAVEGMLATQIVGVHTAAMDCLRRAMIPGQRFEAREQNLKHAGRLTGLYLRQIEALAKYRGKGQQKITVEHVNVHSGGQAIVGNVSTGGKATASAPTVAAPALEHKREMAMPDLQPLEQQKPRTKRSRR